MVEESLASRPEESCMRLILIAAFCSVLVFGVALRVNGSRPGDTNEIPNE